MATADKKKKRVSTRDRILNRYMDAVLMGDEGLQSVYAFCKTLNIKESTFYQHFNSFDALEDEIWKGWLKGTIDVLKQDPNYLEFSIREKLLSFYFTWFEMLLTHRSFVLLTLKRYKGPENFLSSKSLQIVKAEFVDFGEELVREGEETGEVPTRQSMLNRTYPNGLWLQFMFLLNFWRNDNSKDFTATDAAVEKSVNLSLDLIGRGPVDSMIDFAKFLYQQSKN